MNYQMGAAFDKFWFGDFIAACLAFILAWTLLVLAGH